MKTNSMFAVENLVAAFIHTTYAFKSLPLSIRVGVNNPWLDDMLINAGFKTWAYVGAANPYGQEISETENITRNNTLRSNLIKDGFVVFEGEGIPDVEGWKPETGFFIFGIDEKTARILAKNWDQKSFLFGKVGGNTELRHTQ